MAPVSADRRPPSLTRPRRLIFTSRPDAVCDGIQAILCRAFAPPSTTVLGGHSGSSAGKPPSSTILGGGSGSAGEFEGRGSAGEVGVGGGGVTFLQPHQLRVQEEDEGAAAGRVLVFDTVVRECGLSNEHALLQVRGWMGARPWCR